jgi:hypothetical protein
VCWAKLFHSYGAGFLAVVLYRHWETPVLTQTLKTPSLSRELIQNFCDV